MANDRIKIDIDVEWLPPIKPGPPVARWKRNAIELGIMLVGVALAAWRVWG